MTGRYPSAIGVALAWRSPAPKRRPNRFGTMRNVLEVGICGEVTVTADGRRLPESLFAGRQGRLVFASLVCERARSVRREELAELLWGEVPPSTWPAALSAVISKLRKLLTEAG